ncbi:HK97 gp10 family phage protein [Rhizobium sp.]|uniref:HK97 gp10 family phage protein n=1 Tax=Rhizobium sp. TaxID=391 RepID=UPI0028ABF5D8
MAPKKFAADVRAFADKTRVQMHAVLAESLQDVVEIAQTPKAKGGRMPVDTGYLRNSLVSGLNGSFGPPSADSYLLTIAQFQIGDVIRFAWTAPYARRINSGFSGTDSLGRTYEQVGAHFIDAAAAQWPQIVTANAARLKK